MSGETGDLLQAVCALRKAAEAEFKDNAYYRAVGEIDGLLELTGWDQGAASAGNGAALDFASKLAEVRKMVEAGISGNRFYLVSQRLDMLAAFAPAPAAGKAPPARKPPFDELAALSKARVDEAAAGLGVAAGHPAPPARAPEKTIANGELERRSSEPCLMAELAPPIVEPVAAAAISAKTPAASIPAWATPGLGSPAAQAGSSPAQRPPAAAPAAKAAAEPALYAAAAAHDSKAPPAGKKISFGELAAEAKSRVEETAAALGITVAHHAPVPAGNAPAYAPAQPVEIKKLDEAKPKKRKTLFKLWLDLAFGRKE